MAKNYLLTYSEQLATNIELLCQNIKCERVVFLIKEEDVYGEEKDLIEKSDFILTYNKKNFAEKINRFLSK